MTTTLFSVIPGRDNVASPESITTIVSMDSQMRNCASELAPQVGAPRKDEREVWL
jgi:hypothetical protein